MQEPFIDIDYEGQVQSTNGSYSHLAKYDYLVSDAVTVEKTNTADFYFNHQGAILRLMIDMPETDTYSSVTLSSADAVFTTKAVMDLFNTTEVIQPKTKSKSVTLDFAANSVSTTADKMQLEAWIMISPADFTTRDMIVTVKSATGKEDVVYTVRPEKNFVKGKAYIINVKNDESDEWVDLGLPSGTLWATKNVGAEKETDYGSYIGFGDPTGTMTSRNGGDYPLYDVYETDYPVVNGLQCYVYDITYIKGHSMNSKNDMAHALLGEEWSLPNTTQVDELLSYTSYTKTTLNGVSGYKFTSKKNANKFIFIPCAGYRLGTNINNNGYMYFWTGELWEYPSGGIKNTISGVACTDYDSGDLDWDFFNRAYGFSVRAVKKGK